jgi:hypothetical protein
MDQILLLLVLLSVLLSVLLVWRYLKSHVPAMSRRAAAAAAAMATSPT